MKIKKYVADTMPEAMQAIRKELGPEAVILQSKSVSSRRFFGLLKKKQIEVIAALDPNPVRKQAKPETKTEEEKQKNTAASEQKAKDDEILSEIKTMKKIIKMQAEKEGAMFPPDYQLAYNHLLQQEVEPPLAKQIINKVRDHLTIQEDPSLDEIYSEMEFVIREELTRYFQNTVDYNKKILQFVGPTGVGKTTTLAKVAAHLMLEGKKKVAFITTDTYRIAAVDQLKTYARILNVPLEVAYNADDFEKALDTFSDYDVILIDTAGRNYREEKYIIDLQDFMRNPDRIMTYLVLSSTAKPKDISDVFEQFREIPLTGLIFTKIDETTQYGSMLNIVLQHKIGISFITNGQDVPDDLIYHPKPKEISKLIAGDNHG